MSFEHKCKKCGRKWKVTATTLLMRDKDDLRCSCGEEIISWNGAVLYRAEEVKKKK